MTTTTDIGAAVWSALGTVRDPELDEPVTDLGFVAEMAVFGDTVRLRLRLPTYFCAPNFAYLMVADARDAVAAVPGVRYVEVRLIDHFAADEINAGVAEGGGFTRAFPGHADSDLAELRQAFARKAHRAAQERLCRVLVRRGWTEAGLAGARLADVAPCAELDGLRRRRRDLGLADDGAAPVVAADDGRPVGLDALPQYLRLARVTRVSIDGNASLCRGLLGTRYPEASGRDRAADR